MGLGSFNSVSLERARKKAAEARELLSEAKDPILEKQRARAVPSFGDLADKFIDSHSGNLDNDKSRARLVRCLKVYAEPLRDLRVDTITTDDVVSTLKAKPKDDPEGEPFWDRSPSSAKMARGYIEAVLDAAKARGYRSGENPAAWKGHLDHLLTKPKKLARGHHAAMRYQEVSAFVSSLAGVKSPVSLGLVFLILTASRSAMVLGACWDEIDFDEKVWTVPGQRMKDRDEHRVPLSQAALDVLESAKAFRTESPYIFPGAKAGRPLSGMAFEMLLRRAKLDVTPHGFRSSFRDWAGDETDFAREVAEAALAHVIGDESERAYRRGDALEKRRALMEAWAEYCGETVEGALTGEDSDDVE